jgi:hypothetical protein
MAMLTCLSFCAFQLSLSSCLILNHTYLLIPKILFQMNFKSLMKLTTMFLLGIGVLFFTSCGDDGGPVIDPGTGGINVADGFYITKTGVDPVSNAVLKSETVEDTGFGAQARAGFLANYVYLDAGSYNVVQIQSKEIVKTLGGPRSVSTDAGSGCGFTDYETIASTDGGAAFAVQEAGLYKVSYDALTGEIFYYHIEKVGLIGSATAGGWGADTDIPGSVTAAGGTWEATGVELRAGEFKIRFNCNWNIDRRLNKADNDDFSEGAGYMLFTNFGGSVTNLLPGNEGSNIAISAASEGIYTVKITWAPAAGFAASLTKTGDVTPILFVPDDHEWAITGDATPNGWADDDASNDPIGVDHDFNYEGKTGNTYTWELASIVLSSPGAFKFRSEDNWNENLGWGQLALEGDVSDFSDDGGNISVAATATYKIVLVTSDEGMNYTATFTKQ